MCVYGQGIDVGREVIRQTVVFSESELFPPSGSVDDVVTEATLVITPATVGFTTRLTVAFPPFEIEPR